MSGRMNRAGRAKNHSFGGAFAPLAYNMLDSVAWRSLSDRSRTLYIALERQHNGRNNGNLSMPFSEAQRWGVTNKRLLTNAMDELWQAGFIILTREGGIGTERSCNLWGLSRLPILTNHDLGIVAQDRLDSWKRWTPGNPSEDYLAKSPAVMAKRAAIARTLAKAKEEKSIFPVAK